MKGKELFVYFIIFIVSHITTYFLAGFIARGLGVFDFYPPSSTALSYLRNPMDPHVWQYMFPAQTLRAILYGTAILPIFGWIRKTKQFKGGLIIGLIIFLIGYVASSGGLIEHEVFFTEYPLRFALISLVEILIQSFLFGQAVLFFAKKFLK